MTAERVEDVCCDAPPRPGNWARIAAGAFLAGNSMTIALAVNLSEVEAAEKLPLQSIPLAAALAVLALLGAELFRNAWSSVRAGRVTIESLFVVAMVGAFVASAVSYISGVGAVYFEVTSILLVVYSLGQALAGYTKSRVVCALAEWDPALMTCEVVNEYGSENRLVADVRKGDCVRVHPGSIIPVDGVVVYGEGLVQEGGITGELLAGRRCPGQTVLAGAHLVDATLLIRATAAGSHRSLDRIMSALLQALKEPGASQAAADRIARWFVPAVLITAMLTFLGHCIHTGPGTALFNAMAVLLVACPCALGFATPVAVWTAMRRLQRLGLHVKRGDAIEKLANVDLAVFDKTGTLALPDPAPILRVEPDWRSGRVELEKLMSAAESAAKHPVARILAQVRSARGEYRPRSLRVEPGRGIAAEVETAPGVSRLVRIAGASATAEMASLTVEIDGSRAATVLLRETKRPHVSTMQRDLQRIGVAAVLMTGDRMERTAPFGFTNVHASLGPEQKHALVLEWKQRGRRMVFVGDGINDAAAMAASDVSIAIGSEPGLPQQVASIIWPEPSFDRLTKSIVICRNTLQLVRSNLHLALAYNVVGITVAAAGLLHPVVAVLLMTISGCVVILRSLRLLDRNEAGLTAGNHGTTP
jgi:heavy metal translocating P-type ATPase